MTFFQISDDVNCSDATINPALISSPLYYEIFNTSLSRISIAFKIHPNKMQNHCSRLMETFFSPFFRAS